MTVIIVVTALVKYFIAALKLEPANIETYFALEKLYTEDNRYEKSLEHLQAALRIDPFDSRTHYRLGVVYRKVGRTQDANRELALFNQHRSPDSLLAK